MMQLNAIRKVAGSVNPESVKKLLAEKIDSAAFNSWISPLGCYVENSEIRFVAQNIFSADFIKRTYFHILQSVASEFECTASIGIGRSANSLKPLISVNDNEIKKDFELHQIKKSDVVSFDSFISSEQNAFALSACRKIASGTATFSPLFIYGAEGCGKSLLARAIENESSNRVLYMTGAQFVSEFLRSMSERSVFAFKDLCRACDTFILDDIQNLIGKRATSDEFLSLLMDLIKMRKNVVITSNSAPAAMAGFDRRMQSLLASGLVVDIAAPNKAVRVTMLTRTGVSAEVAESLAGRIDGNGHLVAGVASKISAYSELMNERVSIGVAERLLADSLSKNKTPLAMARAMSLKLGVSFDDIASNSRTRSIVRARQIMMAAFKSATNLSLSEIGRILGDRDHATILYGLGQIEKMKETDLVLSAEIDQMINECK